MRKRTEGLFQSRIPYLILRASIKAERHINRIGRRFGMVPAEYFYINGRKLRVYHRNTPADIEAIHQCLWRRQYDVPEVRGKLRDGTDRLYENIIRRGKHPLIIDGGANIGASSLWFATRFPAAHIVAVEPSANNCVVLRSNSIGFDIDIWEAGLGTTEGTSALVDTGFGEWAYRTIKGGRGTAVPIVTVEKILTSKDPERYEPFLLKLDIEGSEAGMFDGAVNAVHHFPIIAIELHDWMLPTEGSAASFLRFHVNAQRDFTQRGENVFSIDYRKPAFVSNSGKAASDCEFERSGTADDCISDPTRCRREE